MGSSADRIYDAPGRRGARNRSKGTGYDNGHGPASGYDRPDAPGPGSGAASGQPNGYRRAVNGRGRDGRSNGASNGDGAANGYDRSGNGRSGGRDGQWRSGGPDPDQSLTGSGRSRRGRNSDPRDGGERFDIKARLGAITGTGPVARRGTGGRAAPGPGPAFRAGPDDDSFEDMAGYQAASTRSPATALRDRPGAPRVAGASQLPSRRPGGQPPGGGSGDGSDGDGPSRRRRKGSWWRDWTWKKALAVAGVACATVILLVIVLIMVAYGQTQIPTDVSEAALAQSSTVYFTNGKTVVGTFSTGTNREMLQSAQIPALMKNAMVAAEDRQFYTEGGVSPTGILRAAYEDVSGGAFQGGSTITQQFVRQYYATIGTQQTASRKIKEIFVAIKL